MVLPAAKNGYCVTTTELPAALSGYVHSDPELPAARVGYHLMVPSCLQLLSVIAQPFGAARSVSRFQLNRQIAYFLSNQVGYGSDTVAHGAWGVAQKTNEGSSCLMFQ
jgi:hypothetical protein